MRGYVEKKSKSYIDKDEIWNEFLKDHILSTDYVKTILIDREFKNLIIWPRYAWHWSRHMFNGQNPKPTL